MLTFGQEFIGKLFLTWLFEAVRAEGHLKIHRPEGVEDVDLRECPVTYVPEKEELVIHHGLKTTAILIMKDWIALQYIPDRDAKGKGILVFRKAANFALEVMQDVRNK